MDVPFCFLPYPDCFVHMIEGTKIEAFSSEADHNAISSVAHKVYAAKATGVVFPFLSFFKPLYTGSIYMMKPLINLPLIFFFQTSTTLFIS